MFTSTDSTLPATGWDASGAVEVAGTRRCHQAALSGSVFRPLLEQSAQLVTARPATLVVARLERAVLGCDGLVELVRPVARTGAGRWVLPGLTDGQANNLAAGDVASTHTAGDGLR